MSYLKLENQEFIEITEQEFNTLAETNPVSNLISGGLGRKFVNLDFIAEEPDNTPLKVQQAKQYLNATDFKAQNGTLTPAQEAKRTKARQLLDGSFVEPPSDLFDV